MNEQGYTLLEVTLFLAISGLLALVAFIGLGPRLRNVRFTDAVRSLESSIQRNLAESNLGSRQMNTTVTCSDAPGGGLSIPNNPPGGTQPGSSGHCVLNGRAAIISDDRITYRAIVSRREALDPCTETDRFRRIAICHRATVLANTQQQPAVYTYSNGVRVTSGLPDTGAQGYGYMINPENGSQVIFNYQHTNPSGTGQLRLSAVTATSNPENPVDVCYALSSRRAQITFSNQTLTPIVNFEGC